MNSLRLRLILGFSLVALVPLAVAMTLFSARIREAVEQQADGRLGGALVLLRGELHADGERLSESVAELARDPELRRLYLVEAATDAELRERLASQQFLLGLDYLWIADTSGALAADGAVAGRPRDAGRAPLAFEALPPVTGSGLALVAVRGVPALALDAAAPIRYRDQPVGWVRGGVLLDSMRLARLTRTSGVGLALTDAGDRRVASTWTDAGRHRTRSVPLALGRAPHPTLTGFVSTTAADESIASLRITSLALGLLGVAIAIALGVFLSHQLSRPVERLAAFSQRVARGEWNEPLRAGSLSELQALVTALERMRADLGESRDRLAAGERQAAYGQMARKVAHEIKNPLTPIAISVADLKRSFDQGRPDFPQILDQAVRTIGDEVQTLKRLIQEFSDFGRFPPPRFAPFDLGELLADLAALHAHEAAAGRLVFTPTAGALTLRADRDQLRQALLNLIQNGLDAVAAGGRVEVRAAPHAEGIEIVVSDTGPGLTAEQRSQLFVPGFTTKTGGSGLGLTIVERIVSDHRGTIAVDSASGAGTTFRIRLALDPGA